MTDQPAPEEPARLGPFWTAFRRREPDVDLVLLPPQRPASDAPPPAADPALLEEVPALVDALAVDLWADLLAGPPSASTSRWRPAPMRGARDRDVLLARTGVDEVDAATGLARAEQALRSRGYDVFVPPTGLPRVTAARDVDGVRTDVAVLHVPATGRFVVHVVQGPYAVEPAASDRGGAS